MQETQREQRLVDRAAHRTDVVARALERDRRCLLGRCAGRAEEELRQPLVPVAYGLAVHFDHVAIRHPADAFGDLDEQELRGEIPMTDGPAALSHPTLLVAFLGDHVREPLGKCGHVLAPRVRARCREAQAARRRGPGSRPTVAQARASQNVTESGAQEEYTELRSRLRRSVARDAGASASQAADTEKERAMIRSTCRFRPRASPCRPLSCSPSGPLRRQQPARPQAAAPRHSFPSAFSWPKKQPNEVGLNAALVDEAVKIAVAAESQTPRDLALAGTASYGREPFDTPVGPFAPRGPASGLVVKKRLHRGGVGRTRTCRHDVQRDEDVPHDDGRAGVAEGAHQRSQ